MSRWLRNSLFAIGAGSSLLVVSATSFAQEGEPAAPPPAAPPAAPAPQAAPAPAPAETAAPATGSDHDMWAGHVGVGWYGIAGVPLARAVNGALPDMTRTVPVPAVGVRYWLDQQIGIDAALGFAMSSGSDKVKTAGAPEQTNDHESYTAFLLHGGVPIVLGGGQHLTVLVTPEVNFGFASGTLKAPSGSNTPDTDESGLLLQAGARLGGELYFGFIGVPQLALDASVGLYFQTTSSKASAGDNSVKSSETSIATAHFQDPWDIFKSTIAARYYF